MTAEMKLLQAERRRTTFNVEELTNIIDDGKKETETRRHVEKVIRNDPNLKQTIESYHMSRDERFAVAMKNTVYVYKKLIKERNWNPVSSQMLYLQRELSDLSLPIHAIAFIPSLMSFGSEEQVSKWLPLALNLNITGTYAQTELGHGTFLRGLETEAVYDASTEEFIINHPRISSMKWWPGDLGKNSNHALVMANLKVNGITYGMHPFIVQIRDLTTHQPMPGVSVGDMGLKLAFDTIDNGFLYLQNVRIPRANLLCKNAEVLADGTYRKKASDRLMYGSMVNLRVNLQLANAVLPLAKVLTIAIRYSAVRCQGLIDPKKPEVPVLDYVTQQYKLLPYLAAVFANLFAVNELRRKHKRYLSNFDSGDISELPELHALSAGMKAFVTDQCACAAEIARRACGGHGYCYLSGIPNISTQIQASCTYEGENTVMYLQCARYLVKCMDATRLTDTVSYLRNPDFVCSSRSPEELSSLDLLVKAFQQRAKQVVKNAVSELQKNVRNGQEYPTAWNNASVFLLQAGKAHIMQSIIRQSTDRVKAISCSASLKKVLVDLVKLYGFHLLNNETGDFLKFGILNAAQCKTAQHEEMNLLSRLRPNAVGLVDAFEFSDRCLQSCLGAYDGNVYERMYEAAKRAPLNKTEVHEASYQYLKPFLHEGRDILEGRKSKL